MKDWIKRADRDFTDTDFPIWIGKADTKQVQLWMHSHTMRRCEPLWDTCTHWKPARPDFPPPPPNGPTQAQKDGEAFHDFFKSNGYSLSWMPHPNAAWHAALAYERAEVLKLVAPFADNREADESLKAIRKRCTP